MVRGAEYNSIYEISHTSVLITAGIAGRRARCVALRQGQNGAKGSHWRPVPADP